MIWGDQFLTEVQKILDSEIFPLGLSIFRSGARFPFDKGQSIQDQSKTGAKNVRQKKSFVYNVIAELPGLEIVLGSMPFWYMAKMMN